MATTRPTPAQRRSMTRADIEREARAFLERCRGDGPKPANFEDIVRRAVDLTIKQRRAASGAPGAPADEREEG